MAEKDDKKHEDSNADEDYGLPKVEIEPIAEKTGSVPNTPSVGTGEPSPPSTASEIPEKKAPEKGTVQESFSKSLDRSEITTKKKADNSWLLWLLLLVVLGLGGWFYYVNNTSQTIPPPVVDEEMTDETPPTADGLDDLEDDPLPLEPEEEKSTLTVITSRVENPRYFLVVGSFIDEDMAIDYSKDLNQKGMSTYLVHPYEQIAYYRLAIGQFESFAQAAVEMERVQEDFKENLWVLKY